MTEGTRLKDVAAKVDHVSAELARLIEVLQQKDVANDQRFEQLETSVALLQQPSNNTNSSHGARGNASEGNSHRPPTQPRGVHVDFPKFDGGDVLQWIFKADQFFEYYQIPDEQRITLASIHFEKEVVPWF